MSPSDFVLFENNQFRSNLVTSIRKGNTLCKLTTALLGGEGSHVNSVCSKGTKNVPFVIGKLVETDQCVIDAIALSLTEVVFKKNPNTSCSLKLRLIVCIHYK